MAQQTDAAREALDENEYVTTVTVGTGFMAWVAPAAASGPAPDPVQVWADHEGGEYEITREGPAEDGTVAYLVEA